MRKKSPKRFVKGDVVLSSEPGDDDCYDAMIDDTSHSIGTIANIMWYNRITVRGKTEKEAKTLRKIIMKELNKQHKRGSLDEY